MKSRTFMVYGLLMLVLVGFNVRGTIMEFDWTDDAIRQLHENTGSRQSTIDYHVDALTGTRLTFIDGYVGGILDLDIDTAADERSASSTIHATQWDMASDRGAHKSTSDFYFNKWLSSQQQSDYDLYIYHKDRYVWIDATPMGQDAPFQDDGSGYSENADIWRDGDHYPWTKEVDLPGVSGTLYDFDTTKSGNDTILDYNNDEYRWTPGQGWHGPY